MNPSVPATKHSKEDEERFAQLFEQLDRNRDGKLDVKELREGIERLGLPSTSGTAQEVFRMGDVDKDGEIDFREFLNYCVDHEKKLRLVFQAMDINRDGVLDAGEIRETLKKLGLKISDGQVKQLLHKMDKDGNVLITWEEWREYLILQPHTSVQSIFEYHASGTNIGGEASDNVLIPDERSGMWWRQLLAGAAAGAVSRTFTAPLDRLKIFFQVSSMQNQRFTLASCFRHMMKEGGARSLWRGNGINVVKIAPESALRFYAYEHVKRILCRDDGKPLHMYERLLAGSTAGVIAQTTIYPMEVLKTRLALGTTGQYRGMYHCLKQILLKEGGRAFYRGLTPSLIGIIPYAGIDLAVYETIKNLYLSRRSDCDSRPGVLVPLACGTISSTCGQLASYPFSLIRTRLQAQSNPQAAALGNQRPPGMMDTFRGIVREEGARGLYRGLLPNFLKVIPAVGIGYVMYEQLKLLLRVETVR